MTPHTFPEANARFGPPKGLDESQVATIHTWDGVVQRGSLDGVAITITAWRPSDRDLTALLCGAPIFLTFIGGFPPHVVTTSFADAKRIA